MLEDILTAHAETLEADYDVHVTAQLEDVWNDFDQAARKALEDLGFDAERYDDDEPRGYDLATIVYHTLTGAGVGLWEVDFAPYWGGRYETGRAATKSLRDALAEHAEETGTGKVNDALTECVLEQAPPIFLRAEIDGQHCADVEHDPGDDLTLAIVANEESDQSEHAALGWLNSARIYAEPDRDRVTVTISVGDPRGAFAMTVERIDGELRLSVPHPDESLGHAPLTQLASAGYYKVGN